MGITGLLPFLEKASSNINVSQFAGGTVAVDSYCWLHKGAFSCADKLVMGQTTDTYVRYCMKLINMLLEHNIKPILVFDGRHLPAKAGTEAKRRESRQANRKQALELIRMGQAAKGRTLLRRSLDITHEMALELIKQCQNQNIDCIVAPYEADAQLAYLNVSGIADLVITEDSDLILFGCTRVFYKMDMNGNGQLVERNKLHLAMGVNTENFDMDKFVHMCILSGCDYLPSLPGIGLQKARKFIAMNNDDDIHRAISRLGSYLNMKNLVITEEYRDSFVHAYVTFKHQLVYCPLQRKQVRLNPPPRDVTAEQLRHAGDEVSPDVAFQLALGNCDPFSMKILHDFDPDRTQTRQIRSNSWSAQNAKHVSVWSREYKIRRSHCDSPRQRTIPDFHSTAGKSVTIKTTLLKTEKTHLARRIIPETQNNEELEELTVGSLAKTYESSGFRELAHDQSADEAELPPNVPDTDTKKTCTMIRRTNPFKVPDAAGTTKVSPNLLYKARSRLRSRTVTRFKRTIFDENVKVESKFFAKLSTGENEYDAVSKTDVEMSPEDAEQSEAVVEEHDQPMTEITNIDTNRMDVDDEEPHGTPETKNRNCYGRSDSFESDKVSECSQEHTDSGIEAESDFLFNKDSVNNVRSSLFKWSYTGPQMKSYSRSPTGLQTSAKKKTVSTRSATRKNRSVPAGQGQSLLSTFGFKKRCQMET